MTTEDDVTFEPSTVENGSDSGINTPEKEGGSRAANALKRMIGALRSVLRLLVDKSKDGAQKPYESVPVILKRIDKHVAEHDVTVQFSDHYIRIVGNDVGLDTFKADLKSIIDDTDVEIKYKRKKGLDIHFQSAKPEKEGEDDQNSATN